MDPQYDPETMADPSEQVCGYTYATGDLRVACDALVLYGVSVQDDGNNAALTLHEGRNAAAPVLMVINALANLGAWRHLRKGVELDNGLFLDLGAHVTSATVFWRPRRERQA